MATKKTTRQRRVVAEPTKEHESGRFDVEELEEEEVALDTPIDGEEEEEDEEDDGEGEYGDEDDDSVSVTIQERTFIMRSGQEVLKSGGIIVRKFSKADHGKNFRNIAKQFIETCQTQDGHVRPKYVSHKGKLE